jgi:hypothetical protein
MANRATIAALTLATAAGLSSAQGLAMDPGSVDEVMVYVSFSLDRRADPGRVGLRFGADVRDDIVVPHRDFTIDQTTLDHLDLRFHERDEGGVLVNGVSLQRRRDVDLFDRPSPQRASWDYPGPRL